MNDAEYDKKESPSTNNQNLYSDENVKREQFERNYNNFIQLKSTCSTLFEKLTARISNYYIVTKNGMNNSNLNQFNKDANLKDSNLKDSNLKDASSTSTNQINLNRNLAARRSSRSNLESSNDIQQQQIKMTRDQLSPIVNAQCLSPRPRPKECG